ncbi:MAG TPA: hypothetical protein ENN17_00040 [bacterium]|nr:hypothetical protein [bacterium]
MTTDEFIRRAEYTPRPAYCRLNNYIHKKIVLNSLIGEKLMAMETDEDHPLRRDETFRDYIRGRKEQAMRQLMYYEEAFNRAKVKTQEIEREFSLAGRKYHLSYLNVSDSARAVWIRDSLATGRYDLLSLSGTMRELPQRVVTWEGKEDTQVHDALFKQPVEKGQVIGPLYVDRNQYLFIRVDRWTENVALTEQTALQRWEDVKEKLQDEKAEAIWLNSVSRLMKDKQLVFVEDTFWHLCEFYRDLYMLTEEQKRDEFEKKYWDRKDKDKPRLDAMDDEALMNYPFFRLDDQVWRVRDFNKLVASHPLVFRKNRMSPAEFPEQFKFAIADLIRDQFITEAAYKKGYDKRPAVTAYTSMWEDALLANYERMAHLNRIGAMKAFTMKKEQPHEQRDVKNYLQPYVDSLVVKYNDQIEINMEAFEKITLTRIDMFVKQDDQPYPIVVPPFPVITTSHPLNYGRIMEF